jgi:hypothetical protein
MLRRAALWAAYRLLLGFLRLRTEGRLFSAVSMTGDCLALVSMPVRLAEAAPE